MIVPRHCSNGLASKRNNHLRVLEEITPASSDPMLLSKLYGLEKKSIGVKTYSSMNTYN